LLGGNGAGKTITLRAIGQSPAGSEAELARLPATFAPGDNTATARLSLPPELRARIFRFEIEGQRSAGAVALVDDTARRRKVAIIAGGADAEGLQLLSPTHYLTNALAPSSDLLQGGIAEVLPAKPHAIILADVAKISAAETEALAEWISAGGTLLRFAGPRMANAQFDPAAENLLPVTLRAGWRATGGAMTWGEAKTLAPFAADGPFAGLQIGADVTVSAQVLAQPSPDLAGATLATLADGTPLVTRAKMGAGQIVLFHITANAEWSTLPLSGLFVQMLERLAIAGRSAPPAKAEVQASPWAAEALTGAFGQMLDGAAQAGVSGADMWAAQVDGPSAAVPAGLYAGQIGKIALNIIGAGRALTAFDWPANVTLRGADQARGYDAKGPLLALALTLLLLDVFATLGLGGRLFLQRGAMLLALALLPMPDPAMAQQTAQAQPPSQPPSQASDFAALRATTEVVLAHVLTGDASLDAGAEAGLRGLGDVLAYRTNIEPGPPLGVDIETDDLDFFPFLYWPVSAGQTLPSADAVARLNRFLRTGGMIMFDTRAGELTGSPEETALQLITLGLDIPPLEPIPDDHVLTRSFYLLDGFPGRYEGAPVWVEAAPPGTEEAPEGMPFRNRNDGVTPIIIGGNDWAAAWAVDEWGSYLNPVGRGFAGEEQREYAYRFGVNVIMHALTGNYKSDQVHVPALLDRLSQ